MIAEVIQIWSPIEFSEELQQLQEMARRFCREEIIPVAADHDKTGEVRWYYFLNWKSVCVFVLGKSSHWPESTLYITLLIVSFILVSAAGCLLWMMVFFSRAKIYRVCIVILKLCDCESSRDYYTCVYQSVQKCTCSDNVMYKIWCFLNSF